MTTTVNGIAGLKELVGQHLGYSDYMEITQERVNLFADATGDHQWIHVDVERATAESPFGGPIAHGYLTLSLVVPAINELLKVEGVATSVNYGLERVRFPAPVPVGSRFRASLDLADVTEIDGGVQMKIAATVEIEGSDKQALVAECLYRHYV
jgi:acyl dehydratase